MSDLSNAELQVFIVLRKNVCAVMPDITPDEIRAQSALSDYGCNSLDRSDIVWKTLDDLRLDVPLSDFTGVSDILGLIRLFARHCEGPGRDR